MHTRHALWASVVLGLCLRALAQTAPTTNPAATSLPVPSTQRSDDILSQSNQQLEEQRKLLNAAAQSAALSTEPATLPAMAATHPTSAGIDQILPTSAPTGPGQSIPPENQGSVIVTSDLDLARDNIAPALGAQTYTLGSAQIDTTPQGENATGQQVLLRAPGVVEDSYGQEHVRGEHANLTYRVNGILLPEGLNGFGQELDTHLIQSLTLIDGSLPAQFGFRTAGIVDVQTKSGETLKQSEISIYGGSNETYEPSFETGGSVGKLDYFVTGTLLHNDLGIENPQPGTQAIHDNTDQAKLFAYLSDRIDDTSRLSLLANFSNADFQIPDSNGLPPIYSLAGHPNASRAISTSIDENQNEQQYYGVLAYQKSTDKFSMQVAAFTRYGSIHFVPDDENDLIFQGVAGQVRNNFFDNGVQFDASYILNDQHTIRAGLLVDYTTERLETSTGVFPIDPLTGAVSSDVPRYINDNSGNHGVSAGVSLQDEWRITKKLTVNYGGRYDRFDTNFADTGQFSPRVNLVYQLDSATTFHMGYSRYFVPPPLQYVGNGTINKFANTTNAPNNFVSGPLKVERSNYYDIGISRQFTKAWQVSLDGFFKDAHNLVDNGQFGDAVIITPFNYRVGQVFGAELSSTYTVGGFSAFGNFSYVNTLGKDIISQQYLFASDELAYIHTHYIKLDHEGEYTASLGASYSWMDNTVHVDALYGSGLRSGFANLNKEPEYFPVNIGFEHDFHLTGSKNVVKFRFDVLNVFNESYQLRSGSGVGVAAPQYGARRAFFGGLSYVF